MTFDPNTRAQTPKQKLATYMSQHGLAYDKTKSLEYNEQIARQSKGVQFDEWLAGNQ